MKFYEGKVNKSFYDDSTTRSLNIVATFTKKQRLKTNFLSIKLYLRLTHARNHFQSKIFTLKMASCMCNPNT